MFSFEGSFDQSRNLGCRKQRKKDSLSAKIARFNEKNRVPRSGERDQRAVEDLVAEDILASILRSVEASGEGDLIKGNLEVVSPVCRQLQSLVTQLADIVPAIKVHDSAPVRASKAIAQTDVPVTEVGGPVPSPEAGKSLPGPVVDVNNGDVADCLADIRLSSPAVKDQVTPVSGPRDTTCRSSEQVTPESGPRESTCRSWEQVTPESVTRDTTCLSSEQVTPESVTRDTTCRSSEQVTPESITRDTTCRSWEQVTPESVTWDTTCRSSEQVTPESVNRDTTCRSSEQVTPESVTRDTTCRSSEQVTPESVNRDTTCRSSEQVTPESVTRDTTFQSSEQVPPESVNRDTTCRSSEQVTPESGTRNTACKSASPASNPNFRPSRSSSQHSRISKKSTSGVSAPAHSGVLAKKSLGSGKMAPDCLSYDVAMATCIIEEEALNKTFPKKVETRMKTVSLRKKSSTRRGQWRTRGMGRHTRYSDVMGYADVDTKDDWKICPEDVKYSPKNHSWTTTGFPFHSVTSGPPGFITGPPKISGRLTTPSPPGFIGALDHLPQIPKMDCTDSLENRSALDELLKGELVLCKGSRDHPLRDEGPFPGNPNQSPGTRGNHTVFRQVDKTQSQPNVWLKPDGRAAAPGRGYSGSKVLDEYSWVNSQSESCLAGHHVPKHFSPTYRGVRSPGRRPGYALGRPLRAFSPELRTGVRNRVRVNDIEHSVMSRLADGARLNGVRARCTHGGRPPATEAAHADFQESMVSPRSVCSSDLSDSGFQEYGPVLSQSDNLSVSSDPGFRHRTNLNHVAQHTYKSRLIGLPDCRDRTSPVACAADKTWQGRPKLGAPVDDSSRCICGSPIEQFKFDANVTPDVAHSLDRRHDDRLHILYSDLHRPQDQNVLPGPSQPSLVESDVPECGSSVDSFSQHSHPTSPPPALPLMMPPVYYYPPPGVPYFFPYPPFITYPSFPALPVPSQEVPIGEDVSVTLDTLEQQGTPPADAKPAQMQHVPFVYPYVQYALPYFNPFVYQRIPSPVTRSPTDDPLRDDQRT